MAKKRSTKKKRRQPPKSKTRTKRGFIWVRGPIGANGRRKPGHWRKKPTQKRGTKKTRKTTRKTKRKTKRSSKASEIRKQFKDKPITNEWVRAYLEKGTYHERWSVPPIESKLDKFVKPYGDINAHFTIVTDMVDKETGEYRTEYRSTVMFSADEIGYGIELLDKLLNKYAASKQQGTIQGFEIWLHDKTSVWVERGVA